MHRKGRKEICPYKENFPSRLQSNNLQSDIIQCWKLLPFVNFLIWVINMNSHFISFRKYITIGGNYLVRKYSTFYLETLIGMWTTTIWLIIWCGIVWISSHIGSEIFWSLFTLTVCLFTPVRDEFAIFISTGIPGIFAFPKMNFYTNLILNINLIKMCLKIRQFNELIAVINSYFHMTITFLPLLPPTYTY